jgi:hypothetical protein
MRQANPVRAQRRLAVVSWLGGAVSIVPFAVDWLHLDDGAANWAILGALVSAAGLGLALALSPRLQHAVAMLAGPPEPPARALLLVAVLAPAGALAMLAALWLSSR